MHNLTINQEVSHCRSVGGRGGGGGVALYYTCDDVRVDAEGVIGRVDAAPLVVLLAEGQRAAVHADAVDVRVAAHCGLWQGQILRRQVTGVIIHILILLLILTI